MMGDYHVRFCERLGVKFPLPTRYADVNKAKMRIAITILFLISNIPLFGKDCFIFCQKF